MGYENIIITLIIAVTIIILAWLANILDIELDWDPENKLPKFKISFARRDLSIPDVSNNTSTKPITTLPYVVENVIGIAKIDYGENAPSFMEKRFTIRALQDDVDAFYYHNSSDTEVKLVDGFSMQTDFVRLRNFSSWIGVAGNSPFANLHRITIPLGGSLAKDETRQLAITSRLYGHYKELLEGMDLVSHGFFFRADAETHCADYIFEIPNGAVTNIFKIFIFHADSKETILQQEIDLDENQFILPTGYGHGWLRKLPDVTQVYWHVPMKLKPGQICRLQWYTKKK